MTTRKFLIIFSGTNSNTIFFTRKELYELMNNSGLSSLDEKFDFLNEEIQKRISPSAEYMPTFKEILSTFKSQFKSRWNSSCRIEERFIKLNRSWLSSSIGFTYHPRLKRGRKEISFEESSTRSKNRKTQNLRENTPLSVLAYATQATLKTSGNIGASKLLKEVVFSPTKANEYMQCLGRSEEAKMSKEEALSVLVEARLSRHQYNIIKKSAPKRFPSYTAVQLAKKECYPPEHSIKVSETSSEISLQSLLNHTVERLLVVQNPVINTLSENELKKLCLYTKWGFDGSSGHSAYKQAFFEADASDSSVFITSIVPLKLVCGEKIIWNNPRPASTRFCRPLKISFTKETSTTAKLEKARVDEEIKNLTDSTVHVVEKIVKVSHNLILSMIDGKVCNALTETTSTQKCFLCGSTSKDFNQIEEMVKKEVKIENLQFGLSILHGWIRFFECLLHLSYKLPIKKWQARSEIEKQIVAETKLRVQRAFKEKAGLIVDQPKPGFGNSNDGNTARRFFQNAELSADITGIKVDLIRKMHIIMVVVSCGHEVDVNKFKEFAHDTARCFVKNYPWYNMPPTLHKFFIHGPEIIANALLPIGQLSEEAQEARNKDFKNYREKYSRKVSRKQSNRDVLNMFLITSDPVISSKRKLEQKKLKTLPKMALDLLKPPSIHIDNDDSYDDDEDSGEDDNYDTDEEDSESNDDDE